MNLIANQEETNSPSSASPVKVSSERPKYEELSEPLQALAIPFELVVVQWRVTEYSDDRSRGMMLPYADPRAYSDRLNAVFTPAGWSRKYAVQTSAPVQRSNRGLAAKILVTCEVTIAGIGTNSGTGEEWSDKENALTGAEAQAFKRALSCFGLGRYLYDIDGEWVDLNARGLPTRIPRLPRWATPNGWLAGLRPKPRRNRHAQSRANASSRKGDCAVSEPSGHRDGLIVAIEAMENKIGKRLYRGLLKTTARVWSPKQIQERTVLDKVMGHMQGAERGLARLKAAESRLAPEAIHRIICQLNIPPGKVEDLHTLHKLVVALEKEVDVQTERLTRRVKGENSIGGQTNSNGAQIAVDAWLPTPSSAFEAHVAIDPNDERGEEITSGFYPETLEDYEEQFQAPREVVESTEGNKQMSRINDLLLRLKYNQGRAQMLFGQYAGRLDALERKLTDALAKKATGNGAAAPVKAEVPDAPTSGSNGHENGAGLRS